MSHKKTLEEKLWDKVDRRGATDCWPSSHSPSSPRGVICIYKDGKSTSVYPSRAAWIVTNGDPGNKLVLHHCDNPRCCNPSHMYLGTHEDNMRDMWERMPPQMHVGENHQNTGITISIARKIKADNRSQKEIAEEYGIHQGTVSVIKSGKHWSGAFI